MPMSLITKHKNSTFTYQNLIMDIKNFTFNHGEKLVLVASIGYLIYIIIHTFITSNLEMHRIDTKLLSLSSAIDTKLKTSTPPAIDKELKTAAQLESRLTTPPAANLLQRSHIFSKFTTGKTISDITTRDLLKRPELQAFQRSEITAPGTTEFILKGGTTDMALIQVRKFYKEKWWTESFTVERGETIGREKTIGKEDVDFDTRCTLIEIIPFAQKPLIMRKTTVLRNEKGEFLGTSLMEERYMISTSKIVFENKKEESFDLWIGELVNLGTETVTIHSLANAASAN